MKARVKETGKEFKVRGILTPTADAYASEEVDLFFDESDKVELLYSEDYWERLKHQYAGMAMQGMLSYQGSDYRYDIPQDAIDIATALVEKLKESKV